jgi:predicted RNA-binding protein YlxR (DUF448 family)
MSPVAGHVPLRRCVVCRASLAKADLVRLVQGDAGWRLDESRVAGGRGTWVCHACTAALTDRATRRAFGRAFRQHTDEVVALLGRSGDVSVRPTSHDPRHGGTHG